MRCAHGNRLGQIHRRATAHGNQAIEFAIPVEGQRLAHGRLGWIGRRLVVDPDGVRVLQLGKHFIDESGRAHARVGHDHRTRDPDALALGLQAGDGAEIELDLGQVVDERQAASLRQISGLSSATGF